MNKNRLKKILSFAIVYLALHFEIDPVLISLIEKPLSELLHFCICKGIAYLKRKGFPLNKALFLIILATFSFSYPFIKTKRGNVLEHITPISEVKVQTGILLTMRIYINIPIVGCYPQFFNKMEALSYQMPFHKGNNYINSQRDNQQVLLSDFIRSMTSRKGRSESYIAQYKGVARYLDLFCSENNCELYTNSITDLFLEDMICWLEERKLRPNTIKGVIEKIKGMVRKAGNYGYAVDRTFDDVSVKEEPVPSIALSMNEITRIYYFKGLSKKQESIRDLFILGCMTGLRYSDYSTLNNADIRENIIVKKTQKTGAVVYIPIHKYVREIIDKYEGFPKGVNIQYYNRTIKDICHKIGFDEEIIHVRDIAGKSITEKYKKYELISSHTARRSFATNMYNSGRFSNVQIMSITGHTSEKNFMRYIKLDKEDSATAICADLFFKQ